MRAAILQPKNLIMLVVVLVLATGFIRLGIWQWHRAELTGEATRELVAISQVQPPKESVTDAALEVEVWATGTYRSEGQLRVLGGAGKAGNAQATDWVLTPLEVTGDDGTITTLAVVRGYLPAGVDLPPPPTGKITVQGRLLVTENPARNATAAPQGSVHTVATGQLMNIWPGPVYAPYLLAAQETPPQKITRVTPPSGGAGWAIQNVSYAIQWWLFAGFVLFIWWRMVGHSRADLKGATQ